MEKIKDEQLRQWNQENLDAIRDALLQLKSRMIGAADHKDTFVSFDVGGKTLLVQERANQEGFELWVPLTDSQAMRDVVQSIKDYASPLDPIDKYWIENFTARRPDTDVAVCALCDQSGKVETKFGPFPCLCPNGRAVAEHLKSINKTEDGIRFEAGDENTARRI